LNSIHPSTVICPITTNVSKGSEILRVHIKKGITNVQKPSDLMMDQIRAIDNKRLIKKIGELPADLRKKVIENIKIALDLE
jgi:mRNA interferase MazF